MVCPGKPGASCLMLSILFHIIDSYPNNEMARDGWHECRLQKNEKLSKLPVFQSAPIFQCIGCCFSRAYPTPLQSKKNMIVPKSITSEGKCCVAREVTRLVVDKVKLENHTECHCNTCYNYKS